MKEMFKALRTVYGKKRYLLISCVLAVVLLFVAALIPSLATLENAFLSPILNREAKWSVFIDALFLFRVGYTPLQQVLVILGVFLLSIYLSMLLQHIRKRAAIQKAGGAGLLGMLIGMFGLGCGACGTFLLSSLLGVTAAGAFLAFLPLRGAEFLFIGNALILLSIYSLAKKINEPMVCLPPVKGH